MKGKDSLPARKVKGKQVTFECVGVKVNKETAAKAILKMLKRSQAEQEAA
jgi:hypothetical protein